MRRKWTDAQKRKMVNDWKESGLTRVEFCKKFGISLSGLDNWRKKFEGSKQTSSERIEDSDIEFVEISAPMRSENASPKKFLRIVSSYGAVIEVPL